MLHYSYKNWVLFISCSLTVIDKKRHLLDLHDKLKLMLSIAFDNGQQLNRHNGHP